MLGAALLPPLREFENKKLSYNIASNVPDSSPIKLEGRPRVNSRTILVVDGVCQKKGFDEVNSRNGLKDDVVHLRDAALLWDCGFGTTSSWLRWRWRSVDKGYIDQMSGSID